jgi:hypothetical protein
LRFGAYRTAIAITSAPLCHSVVVAGEYYSGEWVGPAFSTEQETRDFMQQNTPIGSKLSTQYKPDNPKLNLLDIDPALWDKGRPITLGL